LAQGTKKSQKNYERKGAFRLEERESLEGF